MEELKQFGVIPVDVAALETVFSSYSFPQKKITTLEQTGKLIRLKRGLYVVAPGVSGRILSEELIANHLYGASYVSMETALRYYGQIPENVYTVTSMTLKLTKYYENSVGKFDTGADPNSKDPEKGGGRKRFGLLRTRRAPG